MSLVGGARAGLGGVRTAGEVEGGGGGGGGTVESVTSPDGSITVTNPTGPDVQIEVTPSSKNLLDLTLSYGHGMDVDANLPAATSFWLSPTTFADLARADQVREWPLDQDLTFVELQVVVSESSGLGAGLPLIVTVDGGDTAIVITVPDGITFDTLFSASAPLGVDSGSFVGVRVDGSALGSSATLRMQARLIGSVNGPGGGGLAFVSHDATLVGNGTPSVPLSTRIKGIQALLGPNGIEADFNSGSGVYTLRGAYLPPGIGGGLFATDVPGTGRKFQNGQQLLGCFALDALTLNDSQLFAWAGTDPDFQTEGSKALITGAWIVVKQFSGGVVTTTPEISLTIDGTTDVCTHGAITATAAQFNSSGLPAPAFLIPVSTSFQANLNIQDLVNGQFGGPGLTAKVTQAAVGPTTFFLGVLLQITLDLAGMANP